MKKVGYSLYIFKWLDNVKNDWLIKKDLEMIIK